jgi:hypothetical protein
VMNHLEHVAMNPDHEIKLKISNKMIARGMGASLPSDIYGEGRKYYWPSSDSQTMPDKADVEKRNEYAQHKIPNYNLFKRNSGRSLLGYDYEYADEDNVSKVKKSGGKSEEIDDFYELFDEKQENCSQSALTSVNKTTTAKLENPTTEKIIKSHIFEEATTKTSIISQNKTAPSTTVIDTKPSTITPATIISLKLDFILNKTNLLPPKLINGTFEGSALVNVSSDKIDGKSIKKREALENFKNKQRYRSAKQNNYKRRYYAVCK